MCGIFALISNFSLETLNIAENFELGKNRGPEDSILLTISNNLIFGFHRLAINGLNEKSNQPFIIDNIYLICNGEIYNYKILYETNDITPTTDSDCEIIIHLYIKYGFEHMLKMLDGVFAFVLYDSNNNKIYVARDFYGIRPLYIYENENFVALGSEIKTIHELNVDFNKKNKIIHFPPSTYYEYEFSPYLAGLLNPIKIKYYTPPHSSFLYDLINQDHILENIRHYFTQAVYKRCLITERPIACLLSGGLDSSLVAALVSQFYENKLETFSIGLKDSEDLKYARIVADYLGTNHTEIILTEEDFISSIPEVIHTIESYDTTTIRASIGNYKLGEYISKNSNAKVIFNGDGSDELCGGYLYMENCPSPAEFDKETRRLLNEIYLFDVLRSDKCISSHGLEPRTPFLDKAWVQYYLSIPPNIRMPKESECTKFLLRKAFDISYNNRPLLPSEILWRRKEAFSDGVSKTSRSLYQIIQESDVVNSIPIEDTNLKKEKKYYKDLFMSFYSNSNILPHYWMPNYVPSSIVDASARTLSNY